MVYRATFAAGCFWGVEATFRKVKGITNTRVGYMGGDTPEPNYELVCSGQSGHAEVVEVEYDPNSVSFEELLAVFWHTHDPTSLNRQGADVGTQYRSAIFYHSAAQQALAERSKKEFGANRPLKGPIVTEIQKAGTFYPAEDYHQQYLEKRGKDTCSDKFL